MRRELILMDYDLAFEWTGGNVTAMCKINPYCQTVLHKHWPDIPNLFRYSRTLKGGYRK